ncbi:MAG: pyruvate kinase [Burkholderiales bacterium]|nr:pyruvate kinase [Burkholderiales bacterium]
MEPNPRSPWNAEACQSLIAELRSLREAMRRNAAAVASAADGLDPAQRASALNLAHYLALRRHDLRALQGRLAGLGLSSLGRAETHVLANVDKVLGILHRLAGLDWTVPDDEPVGARSGPARLAAQAQAVFGAPPPQRRVRTMVTLPAQVAADDTLAAALVAAGMDVARINCAHDDPATWAAMAGRVRQAARAAGRELRVLMDLAGPKLRSGEVPGAPPVLKLRPARDPYGQVVAPARLGLQPHDARRPLAGVPACIGVDADWLRGLQPGDRIELRDARGARRELGVIERTRAGARVECDRSAYLVESTLLRHHRRGQPARKTPISGLPSPAGGLRLQRGDRLRLRADGPARAAEPARPGHRARAAEVACTLPEVLSALRRGEQVWFDDGRIGGIARRKLKDAVEIEIVHAGPDGAVLRADKGINLPDTRLELPALTAQDLQDLASVVQHADLVGLSFAQSAADVHTLHDELRRRGRPELPVVLKIETRRGFEALPKMLLAAMRAPAYAVMIARGDLAVECGYERMAEVQEEILWACEAAHAPVVWATQVLESMARTGLPSRAEITDAAMGGRAECVMLNKGAHVVEALRALDDILRRMQAHQAKKRPLLRALRAWDASLD